MSVKYYLGLVLMCLTINYCTISLHVFISHTCSSFEISVYFAHFSIGLLSYTYNFIKNFLHMLDNTLLCESCVLHFLPVYSVSVTLSPFKVSVESKILDFNSEIYSSSLFFKKLSI